MKILELMVLKRAMYTPLIRGFGWILLLFVAGESLASNQISEIRMWPSPEKTRLVFDISAPVEHKIFQLDAPQRVVIDLQQIALKTAVTGRDLSATPMKRIRSGERGRGGLRLVLDLKEEVTTKSYLLPANDNYGNRLVVELIRPTAPEAGTPAERAPKVKRSATEAGSEQRDIIVAIDAGHGGEDPGAIGPGGLTEKSVVLAIARELQKLVSSARGLQAVMIRDGDYFVSLRDRMRKARSSEADLMISIHADSFTDARVKGASVYTLSERGATSEQARMLAAKENASDLVGGVSIDDKDNQLASVLLDLSQTATIVESTDIASRVLGELERVGKLHKQQVEQAGFLVLKSPDVSSILVETAFISNPTEARRLKSNSHQRRLAKALMAGISSYFEENPPRGTLLAADQEKSGKRLTLLMP
ncbi:MAG: N-acetylmuramoyl-L-alanine amidase [Gammaproteobacteria bacterium]|nr:N-acetylmuramoyl-L-alanine amidase [Gammaproteobacteria bacterium]